MERAHRRAAQATGTLSGILARGRGLTPSTLESIAFELEAAAETLRHLARGQRDARRDSSD